jgi:urea carboxylase-associated protein 2
LVPWELDVSVEEVHATYDVPGGAAISVVVPRCDVVRLTTLGSGGNASMLLYAARGPYERLNVPDTLKAQMSARITPPMVLMSQLGRALCSVTGSSLDWHDAITGHSTDAQVRTRFGGSSYASDRNDWRRSARRGFLDELWKHDLGVRDLHASVNWFTKVVPADDERGTLTFVEEHADAGDWVELRAEVDVLLVLSTAMHPLDPAEEWQPRGLRVEVGHGSPPGPDDPSRLFRDESARSLQLAESVTA